jgi:hypothetical protein
MPDLAISDFFYSAKPHFLLTCIRLYSHQPSAISHQPSAISHQPSAISHQPSDLRPQTSDPSTRNISTHQLNQPFNHSAR